MQAKLYLLLAPFLLVALSGHSAKIYKHQIVQSEVDELNKLGDELGITGTGWPVSGEESDKLNVEGVAFTVVETQFKMLVQNESDPDVMDSLFVKRYQALTIRLSNHNLSGSLPDVYLPLLEELTLAYNAISGELILFTGLPSLKILSLSGNNLTSIHKNFGLPNLETVYLSSNDFSGALPSFNCPRLESLNLSYHNFSGEIPTDMNLPSCKRLELRENQLTGQLPDLSLPSLEHLDVSHNKLSGEIPNFTGMPVLETAYLGFNDFTSIVQGFFHATLKNLLVYDCKLAGSIPNISLPQGERLSLSGNDLSGSIPEFSCPNLMYLSLAVNNLTGSIPDFDMPKLVTLELHENNLSGSIPGFSLPELTYLDLQNNELTDTIPLFNCPKLEELELGGNNLEGTLPPFSYPFLEELDVTDNNLSGPIPAFDLPSLEYLDLNNNHFSGPLPSFNFPNLVQLNCVMNNLSGSLPDFDMPLLEAINLYENQFTGEIPVWNLPLLKTLTLHKNDLEGTFDNSGLPSLFACNLTDNSLSDLVPLKINSPNLYIIRVEGNQLTFEDLEPNMDVPAFTYNIQDSVEHFETQVGSHVNLTVRVGGTANAYQWYQRLNGQTFVPITGATRDSVSVPFVPNAEYTCKITNSIATQLTLYSKKGIAPSCITIGNLELCTEDSEWESKEKNEVGTTGKIRINNLLIFEGNMIIDTVSLAVKADGEFYMSEIPIPGGTIGKYSFCKGEYELKLAGEDGAITNFLDSKFDNLGQLFGIDLKLSKLELVGGRNATGIKMDCTIGVPGISGSCGDTDDSQTEFELSGLEFSSSGIALEGVEVTDLGLFLDGYCLNNLTLSYDSENDIAIAGAHVELPFGEIGGGFKLDQGYLDSIAWHLEAAKPPFVIGTTTIGIKGFFGHISSITQPQIEIELGGIFSDITSENFYLINASGRTVWPSLFAVKGEGQFLKPPLIDKPYQVNGSVEMEYDHPGQLFTLNFDGKIGTDDEETWLLQGEGMLKLSTKFSPPKIAGEVQGTMILPELDDEFPYNWLNSMFPFPVEASANSTFIWGRSRLLHGTATFQTDTYGPYGLKYVMDLSKNYGDEDYLWFETTIEKKSARLKSGSESGELVEEAVIAEHTEFAVFGILSDTKAPASTLTAPTGKTYTGSSDEDNVVYSLSEDEKEAFWTMLNPEAGKWEIILHDPAENDSIMVFARQADPELNLSMTQQGRRITVSWDPTPFTANQTLVLMLDDNDSGFDGFGIAEGPANTGELEFDMNDSLSACLYYLFAQVSDDSSTLMDYADGTVYNPKATLAPPVILEASYDPESGITTVCYENSVDPNTVGYILEITDPAGNDSLYAILNARSTFTELVVEGYENKAVVMTSFDRNGLQGCPSEAMEIYSTSTEDVTIPEIANPGLAFYPNPTTGYGTIKYSLPKDTYCRINITDFTGSVVAQPVNREQKAGIYFHDWDFGNLPNGLYIIVLQTKHSISSVKCILTR
jgi:Leucine-rich repeat (LRR) protein